MDFGEILTKAWKIVWKYKILWVFGILASFGQGGGGGGGGGGGNSYSGNSSDFNFNFDKMQGLPPEWQHGFDSFSNFMSTIQWWWIALIILGLLIIALFFMVLSIIGKNGLILGTKHADQGAEKLTFGILFSESLKYFWRVLGFSILTGLAMFILLMILIIPAVLLGIGTMGVALLCLVPLMCIMVPALMLVGIVIEQGVISIVVEDCGIIEGLKHGWTVFKSNFWNMVLMAIILGIIAAVIGFIISLPLVLAFLPILIPVISSISSGAIDFTAFQTPLLISIGLCCLLYPFILLANGILVAYVQSAWTLTYLRVTKKAEPAVPPEIPDVLPPLPNPS